MTHTPGPWRVSERFKTDVFAGKRFIASTDTSDTDNVSKKDEANALLIAESPAMLELLRRIVADEGWNTALAKRDLALAKAIIARIDGHGLCQSDCR